MHALASPASLKGVLTAREAAAALARGSGRRGRGRSCRSPTAARGRLTSWRTLGGEWQETDVSDPLGRPVRARWLLLEDGTALVESAQAIGLGLVAEEERDPLSASSRGLGELIVEVQDADPAELVVFLGGTATVDGGAGLMEVLGGFRVPVRAACDVRAPLLDACPCLRRAEGRDAGAAP